MKKLVIIVMLLSIPMLSSCSNTQEFAPGDDKKIIEFDRA